MFYTYIQNNTGGNFDINDKLEQIVIIEALTAKLANKKGENIGMYWDGVEKGIDCECCGDRWHMRFDENGTNVPSIYGDPVNFLISYKKSIIIYYIDGTVKRY